MNPELEALLKAYDAFRQAPEGPEATQLYGVYQTKLVEAAERSNVREDVLDNAVTRFHPRWVRANLPPGFPKKLGL